MEITKREILISIVMVLFMSALGYFFADKVHNLALEESEKYFKSLKVDNDTELFQYALRTNVGYVLSSGEVTADKPVSDDMIKGKHFAIRKDEEHYVMKTRTVTYTDANGNTKTKTETYWEWDLVGRDYKHTKTFTYLGKKFKYDDMSLDYYSHNKTVKTRSDVRFKIYTVPTKMKGSVFGKTKDGTIADPQFSKDKTIKQVVEHQEGAATRDVVLFWVLWVMIMAGAVFGFMYMDNRYLNGKG